MDRGATIDWVRDRLVNFPMPGGKAAVDSLAADMAKVEVDPVVKKAPAKVIAM